MSFRQVNPPACPVPLNCGDTLTDTNFNALVSSVHSIHESGRMLVSLSPNKVSTSLIPVCGHYGNNFSEQNLSIDIPIELFPGYTHYAFIWRFKLYFNAAPARYHTVQASLINGSLTQNIGTYTSNPLGSGYIASIAEEQRGTTGAITPAIVPTGNSQLGYLRLSNTFNLPRGSVTGAGAGYYQGVVSVMLKQFLPCP